MSEQNTHSYITFSILNCCNFLKFNVFWWVLWVYRWFKHRYRNRDEKVHKTEHFGAKENMKRKTEPSPIDRGIAADRSAKVAKTRSKKAERLPIDRDKPSDRSAHTRESHRSSADRSWRWSRSIGSQRYLGLHQRRSIAGSQPIDRRKLVTQNAVVFQTFMTPNFHQN